MKTRFAPSPTGLLHIGGLRTALYSYLLAKKEQGTFALRVEDTDQERFVEGSMENFAEIFQWLDIEPDEGVIIQNGTITQKGDVGPYIQSERLPIYKQYVQTLLDTDKAYYAFDTKEEIEQMRLSQKQAGNPAPRYDASVRLSMKNSLTLDEAEVQTRLERGDDYVVRLKVDPNHTIECNDVVRGKTIIKSYTVDDQILLKSDGFPTYHLAVVVDDHLMGITHIMRGEEWLPSLPKHILLYEAFGWEQPIYAHLPLLLNNDGTKLSKRQNDVAASDYRDKGYLPEAILNFVALLGWNPGTEQDIFTKEELIDQFSIERIQKSGAVFDVQRLDWFQGQWIRKFSIEEFVTLIKPTVAKAYPAAEQDADFSKKAALIQDRLLFAAEAAEMMSYFYTEPTVRNELIANPKQKVTEDMIPAIKEVLHTVLDPITEDNWTEEHLKEVLFAAAEENDLKRGQLLWPMRALLTGLPFSPGAFEVAASLGKDITMKRIV